MQYVSALFRNRSLFGFQNAIRFSGTWRMTVTDDGSTIVALHPVEKVPYEQTRPLPELPKVDEKNSPLKLKPDTAKNIFFSPSNYYDSLEKLAKLTNTTRHRWYPRNSIKKAKKTPMDRKYL